MPFDRLEGDKVIYLCDCCGREMQMGQGRYEGNYLHELDGSFCKACFGEHPANPRERAEGVKRLRIALSER